MSTTYPGIFSAPTADQQHIFVSKHLSAKKLTLVLRAFDPACDTSTLYRWVSKSMTDQLDYTSRTPQALKDSYDCMIASDFAQPFMGLVNNIPVCQIDVYKTRQDVVSLYYDDKPGDYSLQMQIAPLSVQDNMVSMLSACLEYFFSFGEVGRIVADIDINNDWNQTLHKKVGFRLLKRIRSPYKSSDLYTCTRNSFRRSMQTTIE